MIKVEDMKWSDMEGMVTRRLHKLAMCKRGVLESEFNKREEEMGRCPRKTKKEEAADRVVMAAELKKVMTPSLKDCKELDFYSLLHKQQKQAERVRNKYSREYAPAVAWKKKMAALGEERKARMAELDGDFMDLEDSFKLGLISITDFPQEYAKMEARSW